MRAWRWYAVLGVLGAVPYFLGGTDLANVLYLGYGLAVAIAIFVGVHLPSRPLPWYVLAAGQLLVAIGNGLYAYYDSRLGTTPFPSPADALYLRATPSRSSA